MKCVILQPSYIPWRGYFHQIYKADVFVFYDDVQYDKHGWRNRNRVKTAAGSKWLTIPVGTHGVLTNKTLLSDIPIIWTSDWAAKHWSTIKQLYSRTPHFEDYVPMLEPFYHSRYQLLADLTIDMTIAIAGELGINETKFLRSSALHIKGSKTERLINILRTLNATHYISGPSARSYLEEDKFNSAGISLEYIDYNYPEYDQLHPPFDTQVTILDLLFMVGAEAPNYIWKTSTQ